MHDVMYVWTPRVLTPSTSDMTSFGNRVIADVIKINMRVGPKSNMAGVLLKRGNLVKESYIQGEYHVNMKAAIYKPRRLGDGTGPSLTALRRN